VDTTHFDREFKDQLLASFDNLDGQTDGLLVHGDNFQAFRILFATLNERVKCIYLDPPYNTSEETFVYKNSYQHSSWLAMMADRAGATGRVLADDGVLMVTIDDEEAYRLKMLLDAEIGSDRYIGTVVIQSNPRGRGINSHFATCHEYCLCYAHDPALTSIVDSPLTEAQADGYRHGVGDSKYRLLPFRRSGGLSTPDDRPNSEFAIFYSPSAGVIVGIGGQRLAAYPAEYQTDSVYIHYDGAVEGITLQEFQQRAPADTVAIMPVDSAGQRRVWRWSDREKILRSVVDGDFVVQEAAGKHSVQLKDYIKEGRKPRTIWDDSRYDSSSHGTNLLKDMLGSRRSFGYPKSMWSTRDALHAVVGDDEEAIVMDLFGGSGTTAHAVIDLNRTDGGHRQYVLAEAESYFDDVLLPRVLKAIYSATWRDGKPEGSRSHLSHALKYVGLESYEDALNNLTLRRDASQDQLLSEHSELREDYMLRYALDVESEGSASLLDLKQFEDPFGYTLQVGQGSVGETQPVAVDLVETFNYLLGLRVKHVDRIRGFKVVEGASPQGERVLVIWRNTREKSNADLDEFFEKQGYNTRDTEFDVIYVNGDNNLENLRRPDETWKVRLIEDDFKRLMFDVEDV
jgi:adenine-specific DNA-methyltransferase